MEVSEANKNPIPDYEQLFIAAEENSKNKKSNAIPKMLAKNNAWAMVMSAVLFILKHLAAWVLPLVTAEIINIVTRNDPDMTKKLIVSGIVLMVLIISNYPLHLIYSKYVDNKLRNIGAGLRNTLIRKLQHLSITYHKEIESGKVQSKFMRDIESIEMLCQLFVKNIIPSVLIVLVSVWIAATRSGTVVVFYVFVIPVNVLLVQLFRKSMRTSNYRFRKETESVSAKLTDMLGMIPVTKAHGLENEEIADLEKKIEKLRARGFAVDITNAKFGSVTWIISQLMSVVCLFFTAYLATKGEIPVGDIVLYQSYFNTISGNVNSIIGIYPQITKGIDSLESVSEIVLSNEIEDNYGKIKLRYVHGTVKFDNVTFRYPDADEDLIKSFSLSVEPGECIAFVGASGSGKTTIMNMIIGFLQASEGAVLIDGKPISELNLSDYRRFISVVPQNCILFTGSIRDNITYGLTGVSEEQLNEVIRLSNIEEFANELPNGLDTPVGEGGG